MDWFLAAFIAYFITALVVILDKFLLTSNRVSHPAIYTFYSGILSLFTFVFFPLGFHALKAEQLLFYLAAGLIFAYGVLSLFFAIQKNEASRVTPAVGAIIPVATYAFSFFIFKEHLSGFQLFGIALLIAGGLLISWEFSIKKKIFLDGFSVVLMSGILLALSSILIKSFYERDNFFNVFLWTRLGFTLGAFSLLAVPDWRRRIFSSLRPVKTKKASANTGLLFVFNKILGGAGSLMLNFAISLGSVTVVNALIALEYMFVFLMAGLFSLWLPQIFKEKITWRNTLHKVSAIFIITLGLIFVSKT